jgi:hypothetical protein
MVFEGTKLDGLQYILNEHFGKGARVELVIGLHQPLIPDQVALFEQHLVESGVPLTAPVQFGEYATKGWSNALRIEFHNPGIDSSHVGFVWWIPVAIIGGLTLVGISGWIGFQVGELLQSLAKAVVPVALIIGGVYLASVALKDRRT